MARHHHDLRVGQHPPDVAHEIEAVLSGEHDVEQRHGGGEAGQQDQRFLGGSRLARLAAILLQDVGEDVPDGLLVIDDEDPRSGRIFSARAHEATHSGSC